MNTWTFHTEPDSYAKAVAAGEADLISNPAQLVTRHHLDPLQLPHLAEEDG